MIQTFEKYKRQIPDTTGNYLFNEDAEVFATEIMLPLNAELWPEATEAFKEQWEAEHPVEEPEEIET